jgi:hypothetical protein
MKERTRDIVLGGFAVSAIVAVVLLVFLGMQVIKRNRAMQMRIATAQAVETLTPEHGLEKLWLETPTSTAIPAPSPVAILIPATTPTAAPSTASLPTSTPASKSTRITILFEPEKSELTRPPTTTRTTIAITGPAPSLTATLTPAKTPTGSPSPAPLPTLTRTSTSIPPTTTPTPLVAPAPLPAGQFVLLRPTLEELSYGPTDFRWKWLGVLTPGQGFEVRVWREGETPTGVHNSQQDNFDGKIIALGNDMFHFTVDISNAPGVQGIDGVYLWTVALVQVSPAYKDLGIQGEPKLLRFVRETGETEEDNGGPPRGRY